MHSMIVFLPEIYLLLSSLAMILLMVADRHVRAPSMLHAAAVICWSSLVLLWMNQDIQLPDYGMLRGLTSDELSYVFRFLLLAFGGLTAWIMALSPDESKRPEMGVMVLFSVLGMLVAVGASDAMMLYVGLELSALTSYIMVAAKRDDGLATEAAIKYIVLGITASSLLLFGISLLYGWSGTTVFWEIATLAQGGPAPLPLMFAMILIMTGLFFKIAAAPFHLWVPDVYQGANFPAFVFMSVLPKMMALGVLIRLFFIPFPNISMSWDQVVLLVAMLSLLWGSLAAVQQRYLRRLLGYSTVLHMGFVLLALSTNDLEGVQQSMIYMMLYGTMALGFLCCLGGLRGKKEETLIQHVDDLTGLMRVHPWVGGTMMVFLFSMAGLPPFAGFFAKLGVLKVALDHGFYAGALVAILASVIGLVYYLRMVRIITADLPSDGFAFCYRGSVGALVVITGLLSVHLFYGIAPSYWLERGHRLVTVLVSG